MGKKKEVANNDMGTLCDTIKKVASERSGISSLVAGLEEGQVTDLTGNTKREPILSLFSGMDFKDIRTIYSIHTVKFTSYGVGVLQSRGYITAPDFVTKYNSKICSELNEIDWSVKGLCGSVPRLYFYVEKTNWNKTLRSVNCPVLKLSQGVTGISTLMGYLYQAASSKGASAIEEYIIYYDGATLKLKGVTKGGDSVTAAVRLLKPEMIEKATSPKAYSTYCKMSTSLNLPTKSSIKGSMDIFGVISK